MKVRKMLWAGLACLTLSGTQQSLANIYTIENYVVELKIHPSVSLENSKLIGTLKFLFGQPSESCGTGLDPEVLSLMGLIELGMLPISVPHVLISAAQDVGHEIHRRVDIVRVWNKPAYQTLKLMGYLETAFPTFPEKSNQTVEEKELAIAYLKNSEPFQLVYKQVVQSVDISQDDLVMIFKNAYHFSSHDQGKMQIPHFFPERQMQSPNQLANAIIVGLSTQAIHH